MNLPTIRQLECLVAVSRTLNFSQAASRCYITQPALSAQIQQLEGLLGLKLFERSKRKVMPTDAGRALAERASGVLADLGEMVDAAKAFGQPLSGTLRLGVIPTVAPYVLPITLREVHERHPKLRLLMREGQTSHLVEMLAEGSLDLLLLALEADLGDVQTMSLVADPFVLAVPPSHRLANRKRVAQKDLLGEDVLLLEDGHCLRDQALSICEQAGACEFGDFRASSLTTLVQMVAGGLGITLLPRVSLKAETGTGRPLSLIPFGAKGPGRTLGLAWRSSSIRNQEFQMLGETMRAALAQT